jgi:hypothetical protein
MSKLPAVASNGAFNSTVSLHMIGPLKIWTFTPILLTTAQTCLCTSYRSVTETWSQPGLVT